jgi:hypothetical protein
MAKWYDNLFGNQPHRIDEQIEAFKKVGDNKNQSKARQGEGFEDIDFILHGQYNSLGFNSFYNTYINKSFENELQRLKAYREMSAYPEIADVIEDAAMESTQEDMNGRVVELQIVDEDLLSNKNVVSNVQKEFRELFYRKTKIKWEIWNLMYNYFVDGKVYFEHLVDQNNPKGGLIGIKRLPSETMDFEYDPITGNIVAYYQYLAQRPRQRPPTVKDANEDPTIIVFYPEQISLVHYGYQGATKREFLGYLEKAKQPYNNLRLLETSVVIYRLIRAPERFVFRIDTGNMPKDKAMKYVEKIKQKFQKRQTYDAETGRLTNDPEVFSILENFFLPQSADGRGSQVDSVGGNPSGFAELDDLYYFQRKLYKSLKYPASRVSSLQERAESDIMFNSGQMGEITRDEIKWAKFLERQQMRFCDAFLKMFLTHLELIGMKKQYDLDEDKLRIIMTSPNNYRDHMKQKLLEQNFTNYQSLSREEEFSKYYLMKKYLGWNDDEIEANIAGFKMDKKLKPEEPEGDGEGSKFNF